MATRLTVASVHGARTIDIPADALVLDHNDYVDPTKARYVTVFQVPTELTLKPHGSDVGINLKTNRYDNLRVLEVEIVPDVEQPDPQVAQIIAPELLNCWCGVTCQGTKLTFVKINS